MSKVYSAFKCEACSTVVEGVCDEGSAVVFIGNAHYLNIAKEKIVFEDICEACRQKLRDAVSTAFPHLRWAKAPVEPVPPSDPDYREVNELRPTPHDDEVF